MMKKDIEAIRRANKGKIKISLVKEFFLNLITKYKKSKIIFYNHQRASNYLNYLQMMGIKFIKQLKHRTKVFSV